MEKPKEPPQDNKQNTATTHSEVQVDAKGEVVSRSVTVTPAPITSSFVAALK